jgi:hypothetical protein
VFHDAPLSCVLLSFFFLFCRNAYFMDGVLVTYSVPRYMFLCYFMSEICHYTYLYLHIFQSSLYVYYEATVMLCLLCIMGGGCVLLCNVESIIVWDVPTCLPWPGLRGMGGFLRGGSCTVPMI